MSGSNYAYSTGEFLFDAPEFNIPQQITPKTTNQPVFDPEDGMYDAYIQARNASIGANASKRKQERFYKKFRKQWDQGEALRKSEFDWNNSMQDINSRLDNIQQNFNTGLSNLVKSTQESVNNRQLISKPVTQSIPQPIQESAYARAKREGNTRSLVGQDPQAAAAVSAQESGIIPTTRGIGRNEVSVNPDEFGYQPEQLIQTNQVSSQNNSDKPGSWFRKAAQTFEGATGLGKSLNGLFNTLADWRENGWLERNNSRKPIYLQPGRTTQSFQQGGTMGNQEELQKAFMAFLIEDAAAQGVQLQSEQDLQAYAQQLGEEGLKAKYQEFMQRMQGGVKAKLGTKLNYLRKIKGNCPDGYEMIYMKEGGRVCPVCQKKAEKAQKGSELEKKRQNTVKQWKADRAKAKDEAARDSIAINKYNDQETMANKSHKGKFKNGVWTPNRKEYAKKNACGAKMKKNK